MTTIDRTVWVCPITDLLPHRPPILLVDKVLAYEPGQCLITARTIPATEPCFAGAGGELAYPSTLLIESFAQSCALLFALDAGERADEEPGVLMLGALREVTLPGPVLAGQLVRHEVRLEHRHGDSAFLSGSSSVDGRLVLSVGSAVAVIRPRGAVADRPAG
jgi:3-hydroxyacyl-[acyl-carrier-protein] dehydratase